MAATVYNLAGDDYQSGPSGSASIAYLSTGSDDASEIADAIRASAGTTYEEHKIESVSVKQVSVGLWTGEVRFKPAEMFTPAVNTQSFEFDTTGETQHITQSKATVNSYVASGTAVSHAGAIGVNEDGSVEGVDITVPAFSFTVTHTIARTAFTATYINTLYALTGKTNNASWTCTVEGTSLTFSEGEVLFLGARGGVKTGDTANVTFSFRAIPNATGLSVGGITGVAKKGHEYLWVEYTKTADNTAKRFKTTPKQINVERVYDSGSFSGLGL